MLLNLLVVNLFLLLQSGGAVRLTTSMFDPYSTTMADYEDVNSKGKKSEIFNRIFDESGYDTKLRPPGLKNGTGPTVIKVSLHIRSIENIDDVRMQYSVQLTFRQEWVDPRLKFSHIQGNIKYLQLVIANRIWMPDIFFSNEKEGRLHELMIPNLFTRVFPDGQVMQSYRITLLLSCPMNLRAYPLDVQKCPIQMASYGWTTQDIVLQWRKEKPVDMARDFNMPRFKMQEHSISECSSITATGNYSCIKLDIAFEREFGFYLIQIYVPCSMLSLVSWVTFWLEPTAVEARVSLGVTTILAIVTQTYGINQSAPPASYVKAMDVWTSFCQAMVFGALLEFALVNYITHFRVVVKKKRLMAFEDLDNNTDNDAKEKLRREILEEAEAKLVATALAKAKRIDLAARVLFPLIFCIFNISYWGYYLKLYFGLLDEFKAGLDQLRN
ncbi:glutamate-gated chloride channel isoform X2 [Folsomia candida]|uniref:glutamate-gated chloride channel isoform X2 n=1 Tax=Folsomia candida TaxID=158441 RepID=UPI00160515F6|nr:glutamate-gated chloride channel isoform X2 [Folsomia candida]